MKQAKTIITLGVLVALVPFLGFPTVWKQGIFAVLGLAIVISAYRIVRALRPQATKVAYEPETYEPETKEDVGDPGPLFEEINDLETEVPTPNEESART